MQPPKGFRDSPYPYHHELEILIESVSNLGIGIARDKGWVIQIPFVLPGERIRARIYRNHKNYSDADCLEVLEPSPHRVQPSCDLFGVCGGCQYQAVDYPTQLSWKQKHVEETFLRIGGIETTVNPTMASPKRFAYRSKLTPHYEKTLDTENRKIGFLRHGSRRILVDVPTCPIATDSINATLPEEREILRTQTMGKKKGGTLLLRDTIEGVVTNPKETVSERVGDLTFQFKAGEFFQNNPFLLPQLVQYVIAEANSEVCPVLVDAYCGGGLFGLSAASQFDRVIGIEISREGFEGARTNALLNKIDNAEFFLGDAVSIFSELGQENEPCALIIDPPRKGCDPDFIDQTLAFRPQRIVYVSCDPATQARDAKLLLNGGYRISQIQPFDLFPQTRHIENVLTMEI